jgi:MFS family permease
VAFRSSFPALEHRNFRLIWIGLLLSFSGSFMQNAALLWHVSLLADPGHKGLALGAIGLVRVLPIVFFSLLSGVVADAWDRRRLMLFTQTGSALVALGLAAATFLGVSALWPIYTLAAVGAAIGAFDLPARQSLMPTLVPREHLPNAITLSSTVFQLASVLGPFAGGMLMAGAGIAWVYVTNAVSFGFVIVALLMMDRSEGDTAAGEAARVVKRDDVSVRAALEGLRFVFKSPLIWSTMWLDFLVTFFASATALLPIFAQDVLHVGAQAYGWLYAAPAVGALTVSVLMVPFEIGRAHV